MFQMGVRSTTRTTPTNSAGSMRWLTMPVTSYENLQMTLMGDWNIAPLDTDVWDIGFFEGRTHVTQPERDAFSKFASEGFREVTRDLVDNYTYWDYQQLRFPKNEGMRIDYIYASPALASRVQGAAIDRNERKGKGPSDHVPVIIEVA